MKIVKYKKGVKGLYKVELDNGSTLSLYEDVILKYNLLLTKSIDDNIIDELNEYNLECDVYYVALNNIKSRFKSEYDLRCFLKNKDYPSDLIDKAINKMLEQGYLNDRSFSKSYINNQIITTSKGPLRIEKDLLDKKVDSKIIYDELIVFSEELQLEKIDKIISKSIKSNHSIGGIVLKNKIINDLKVLGYELDVISKVINDYDFFDNNDIAKKEYEKLYRKYSRKYDGKELERIIKEKLYLKGLSYNPKEND